MHVWPQSRAGCYTWSRWERMGAHWRAKQKAVQKNVKKKVYRTTVPLSLTTLLGGLSAHERGRAQTHRPRKPPA